MSSKKTDGETRNYSTKYENPTIDDKFKNLSCPFTWGMKNVIENQNKLVDANENRFETVVDVQDNFPEFVLVYHLLMAYETVMGDDLPTAKQCINKAEQSLTDIKEKATLKIVENVLQHIFVATKCHVLQKLGQATEVDKLLEEIFNIGDMNETESAMLYGCQCLAWSLYAVTDNLMAIKCAEKAIEYECDNGKWYFLLGKNCRRLRRRLDTIVAKPNRQETSAFEKAYRLSKNGLFGVSLAQLYRESGNSIVATAMYKDIYKLQPTCCKVRLQLALGFIRAKECMLAKNCLDYVVEHMPDSAIYLHYMAIYQEKCRRDFEAALPYYKSATENNNSTAEWQYIECRKKVEPDWDPLPYMLSLLTKYEKYSNHIIQGINIHIGSHYLFEKQDIFSACQYLTTAIKISPNAKLLKDHFMLFRQFDRINIYHALSKEVRFALTNGASKYDDNKITVLEDMLQLCHKSCADLPRSAESSATHVSSLRSSSNCRNYGRGVSSRSGINLRKKIFGSSHPGLSGNNLQQSSSNVKNKIDQTRRPKKWEAQGSKAADFFSNPFKDERDGGVSLTAPSKPREKNHDTDTSCYLVKTFEDFKL